MIVRNKKTGTLVNVKDINIKFQGTFSDIINHSTAKFMYENSDPKVFYLDIMDKDGIESTRRYNITSIERLHGSLADLRFKLSRLGTTINKLHFFYKPRQVIHHEREHLTNGIIQDPVLYTVIFNNPITKTNE
jgi:hypothetical protein